MSLAGGTNARVSPRPACPHPCTEHTAAGHQPVTLGHMKGWGISVRHRCLAFSQSVCLLPSFFLDCVLQSYLTRYDLQSVNSLRVKVRKEFSWGDGWAQGWAGRRVSHPTSIGAGLSTPAVWCLLHCTGFQCSLLVWINNLLVLNGCLQRRKQRKKNHRCPSEIGS